MIIKKIIAREEIIIIGIVCVALMLIMSDTCNANLTYYSEQQDGFLWGLWHGLISFIKVPASVIAPQSIHVYNLNNNGLMYNIGFFIVALPELEATIPLLILAWIIRLIFLLFIIIASFGRYGH